MANDKTPFDICDTIERFGGIIIGPVSIGAMHDSTANQQPTSLLLLVPPPDTAPVVSNVCCKLPALIFGSCNITTTPTDTVIVCCVVSG